MTYVHSVVGQTDTMKSYYVVLVIIILHAVCEQLIVLLHPNDEAVIHVRLQVINKITFIT